KGWANGLGCEQRHRVLRVPQMLLTGRGWGKRSGISARRLSSVTSKVRSGDRLASTSVAIEDSGDGGGHAFDDEEPDAEGQHGQGQDDVDDAPREAAWVGAHARACFGANELEHI